MFLCDTHFPKSNIFLGIWLDSPPFWFDPLFLEITSFPMATLASIKILNKSQMCTSTPSIFLSCRIIFSLGLLRIYRSLPQLSQIHLKTQIFFLNPFFLSLSQLIYIHIFKIKTFLLTFISHFLTFIFIKNSTNNYWVPTIW